MNSNEQWMNSNEQWVNSNERLEFVNITRLICPRPHGGGAPSRAPRGTPPQRSSCDRNRWFGTITTT